MGGFDERNTRMDKSERIMDKTVLTKQWINRFLDVHPASAGSFSADGSTLSFITNMSGVPQVWSIPHRPGWRDILWPSQRTYSEERVQGFWYSPVDPNVFIYASDRGGNEKAQLYVFNGVDGSTRCLTEGYEDAMHGFGEWSRDGKSFIFYANRRHPGYFDLYQQELEGDAHLVWQNNTYGMIGFTRLSPDGTKVILSRLKTTFMNDLLEIEVKTGTAHSLVSADDEIRFDDAAFLIDSETLLLLTDRGSDYLYLAKLHLDTGVFEEWIEGENEIDHFTLSDNRRYIAYSVNDNGCNELRWRDLRTGLTDIAPLPEKINGVIGETSPFILNSGLSFSPDRRFVVFTYTTPVHDSNVYLWDIHANAVYPASNSPMGGLGEDALRYPQAVEYPTFDERKIPGLLYEPDDRYPKPWPVVVIVHGGPVGESRYVFNFFAQMLLDQGFAVFLPNVRGSSGYGKAYALLDEVEKRMDSVADLAYAAKWLQSKPQFKGDRLGVYGASYGGFMVLASLTHYPDLWAAGVDVVGMANLATFLENTSEYRRSHREAEYGSLQNDRRFLEQIAPINRIDQIKAPLMVLHGENDPRVPLSETLQLVKSLEERNIPVEKMIFTDEGHGIVKEKNRKAAYPAILQFLKEHLME
jgi:dienelactone hydrolase/Tol biopolymer transport system component